MKRTGTARGPAPPIHPQASSTRCLRSIRILPVSRQTDGVRRSGAEAERSGGGASARWEEAAALLSCCAGAPDAAASGDGGSQGQRNTCISRAPVQPSASPQHNYRLSALRAPLSRPPLDPVPRLRPPELSCGSSRPPSAARCISCVTAREQGGSQPAASGPPARVQQLRTQEGPAKRGKGGGLGGLDSPYLSGMNLEDEVAPIPGRPCRTGL